MMDGQTSWVGRPVETQFAMDLQRQFLELVRAYLAGERRLRDVFVWLAGHAQAVADAHDETLDELVEEAWLLIAEHDAELRDEASVREELADLIGSLDRPSQPTEASPTVMIRIPSRRIPALVTRPMKVLSVGGEGIVIDESYWTVTSGQIAAPRRLRSQGPTERETASATAPAVPMEQTLL